MPEVLTDAGSVAITREGKGDDLCLILPPSAGPNGTATLCDGLSKQFRTLRYAQRGLVGGPPISAQLSIHQLADDLDALFRTLEMTAATLVCHSTGCGIGLSLAARYPERVTSLVLVNPWCWGDPHLVTAQTLRTAAARSLDAQQYAIFNATMLFPHDYRREHHDAFAALAAKAPPPDADAFALRLKAILAFDARPLLADVRCRTLILGAHDDQLMPHWFASDIAQGIEGSELEIYAHGGHMLPETRASEVLTRIETFLSA